jgi:hypothetical protein
MKKLTFIPTGLLVLGIAVTLLYDATRAGSAVGLLLVLSAPLVLAALIANDGGLKDQQFRYELSALALGLVAYSACLVWPNFLLFLLGIILVLIASVSMQIHVFRLANTRSAK